MEAREIRVTCTGAATVPYKDLVPFQGDLKTLTKDNYARLRNQILDLGFSEPCSVWHTGDKYFLLNGHQRLRTVTQMVEQEGYTCPPLPVSLVEASSYHEAKRKILALTSQFGEMDKQGLYEFMADAEITMEDLGDFRFPEIDLKGFGEEYFAEPPKQGLCDDDDAPEPPVEPTSRAGDVYRLGRHRVICGDATDAGTIDCLMAGERADMVVTDPPYNVDYEGKTKEALTIKNDSMDDKAFYQFLFDAYANMLTATKLGGAIYVAHADSEGVNFRKALKDSGWLLKQCLIWVKQALVMGRQDYHWKHEPILYGWAPGASHQWHTDRKQTTVLQFNRPSRSEEHPTMKPVELIEYLIRNSSAPGETVLDTFGGSGTTLIACEKLGRRALLCELDPRYVDVIVARWEKYTGQKAELIRAHEPATAAQAV